MNLIDKIRLAKQQTHRTVVMGVNDYISLKDRLRELEINHSVIPDNYEKFVDVDCAIEIVLHTEKDLSIFLLSCSHLYTKRKIELN